MDKAEAARRLSVAEHEVVDVRPTDGWWEALHHDMASHAEQWKLVPGSAEDVLERDSGVEGSPESGSGDEQPEAAPKPAPASKRKSRT